MRGIFVAVGVSLAVSILLTPYLIRAFIVKGVGQEIREDGPSSHQRKRGTPTMGGVAIVAATWCGYLIAHSLTPDPITASGVLVMCLMTSLGLVGFLDDYIKIYRSRSLGLGKVAKSGGQLLSAVAFSVLALNFPNSSGLTPASTGVSFLRDIPGVALGTFGSVVFLVVIVYAWSNAVNLTDGLDGLAAGVGALILGIYVIISFWQFRNLCLPAAEPGCFVVRDPLDLAVVAAAAMGACVGFLWWNAAPARIFMGDTGSLALGGLLAGISIASRTELLLIVVGAVFVVEALSVVLQVSVFRTSKRRLFRMAPFHHHFELGGWAETTVIIRFWLLAVISCSLGLGLFYGDWSAAG
ncbi:phospho-N-acetylmuramoyl-pentapeptide-transferase [Pseudonocardia sp. EV170527-09]|uniref:phospho-N-acetylmuramoyl-pentapeptide- transferase n=1 Tax=Pseudonocardia sp. EV170527-09 TaxID=2603411 RepID=UPI0011F196E0|nr:phospho-N-acetylmuramoyl-pentapeptide-transferase [Pseudonocardia sp. EV170527-09]KAA1012694.1 phospho-N-acetylmuramoyl-pentapeptide-transferase [Pseudonocardia sp. EV170527-09]